VTERWKRVYNEKLHNFCASPSIIRMMNSWRMRWTGHLARIGGKKNVYKIVMGKPEGKRSIGRPKRRWEDNIKVDLREIE
jgi:hypothetical protein